MNKQQLAAKIWESANKMRSKIEANEYKDYILGFIFYKFLSDKEVKYLKELGFTDADLPAVTEDQTEIVTDVQNKIGYFIAYENLFSTWLAKGSDFNVGNVRDALSAFSRLINPTHKKVFEKIFDTLQTGLSKLGDGAGSQTKAISDLIHLIKDIPMDGKQVLSIIQIRGCHLDKKQDGKNQINHRKDHIVDHSLDLPACGNPCVLYGSGNITFCSKSGYAHHGNHEKCHHKQYNYFLFCFHIAPFVFQFIVISKPRSRFSPAR